MMQIQGALGIQLSHLKVTTWLPHPSLQAGHKHKVNNLAIFNK